MDARHYYFLGTGSWFFSHGIQTVIFAWLVTIVLRESPDMVGIAQMTFLAPAMVLMLVGGSLADQYGGRPVVIGGQMLAAVAVFLLAVCIALDRFTYTVLLLFAITMGCAQALVTPARDGLLALVAEGRIQRRVVQASLIQFAVQMLGFVAASYADRTGATVILLLQCLALVLGVLAFTRLTVPDVGRTRETGVSLVSILTSIGIGLQTVRSSRAMLMVVALNCAMGMFFMGSYMVTVPLLVRELYDGTSAELAWVNTANAVGLVMTIFFLLQFGDIYRQGRALIVAHGAGAIALASAALGIGFPALVASVFLWGMCGGIGMTMSRTIMQEQAPSDQRARIMGFFSFSFMGAGPVGALGNGYMASWMGASTALMLSSAAMFCVVVIVATRSDLWKLDTDPRKHA
ncbi:MAG: MFS transporter [Proteobacteria bacterium]|jgi:MFS family permease|nr:MFS transporter [Pseudomonadota bacterium]MDA1301244.1 MFS transporter [Pseudomonadota bacterium]